MTFYDARTANEPRNHTDCFFDISSKRQFSGCLDQSLRQITELQLRDTKLWKKLVDQFRIHSDDADAGWRGEFWGKLMRSACFLCGYSKDPQLFASLKATVEDILTAQDEEGRISSFSPEKELDGWDLWGRKYVLLGLQYFLEISDDEDLNGRIIDSMCRQVDYLTARIGYLRDGKRYITRLTRHWRGLNSSSILEPIVRLYSLTGRQEYLDFASYIVELGFTDVENIYELAYENELRIWQYPVTKAYEMTSCFVGLLEYYRITKNEKHMIAIRNYANQILEDDFTVIGSAGCTHELFDHSTVRQANPERGDPRAQEHCVTVTLMQFFYQLNLITGDPRYMDAFERALYNAYLGAINTDNAIDSGEIERTPNVKIVPMPFDSYSPLTPGIRGNGTGGLRVFSDGSYYGCCISIGPAGIGTAMKAAVLTSRKGLVVNLYEAGTVTQSLPGGKTVTLDLVTGYPADGKVTITVHTAEPVPFEILLRNPGWSSTTEAAVNGQPVEVREGYLSVERLWTEGDVIELVFDMRAKAIYPIPYGRQILMNKVCWGGNYMVSTVDYEHPETKHHIAIQRGPLMLAQENRLGYSVDDAVSVKVEADGVVPLQIPEEKTAPYPCILEARIPTADGGWFTVTDYASAGKLWTEESKMAVWMNTK